MPKFASRIIATAAVGAGVFLGVTLITPTPAEATQPWYCVCKGEKKRFLASTRHCEVKMGLPKGQWCTNSQTRAVYTPACAKMGCKLAPFN